MAQRKEIKRKDAVNRLAEWRKLSKEEKIAELDKRFGKGLGAKKQRALLSKG